MKLPPALTTDQTDRLPRPGPPSPVAVAGREKHALSARGRSALRRIVDRLARPIVEPFRASLQDLDVRLASLERMAGDITNVQLRLAEVLGPDASSAGVAINLELLKGEVRGILDQLQSLGAAIAPAAGFEGVPARFAELRERVNAIDRRLRQPVTEPPANTAAPAPADTGHPSAAAPVVTSELFDYTGFERRFRGDPDVIAAMLDERYGTLLEGSPPVLDIGCGRAELISRLRDRGVAAYGIDTDSSMVADAQSRGIDVRRADAVEHLRSLPEHTLGSIIVTHVVEHLELDALIALLELAVSRLQPGGVFVAETPNPASLIVLGNSYILDPTHVRPLHPSLLTFLCEGAGFRDVSLRFWSPATDYHLPIIEGDDLPGWTNQVNAAFARLNDVLFGSQEYAVVAQTPSQP